MLPYIAAPWILLDPMGYGSIYWVPQSLDDTQNRQFSGPYGPYRIYQLKIHSPTIYQWPFQEPKLEVPIQYIFGLFFRPKFQGISPQNMALHVLTYLHQLDPESFPFTIYQP
jgi:hypothetical protein